MKKVISLILSIMCVICLTPTFTYAETNDNILTGKCGKNVIWTFDKSTSTVTISGTGKFEGIYGMNFWKVKKVIIEDTIESIGQYAFEDEVYMNSIKIGSGVTEIGEGAFNCCTNLHKIYIPATVKKIGLYALGMRYYRGEMDVVYFGITSKEFTICSFFNVSVLI